MHHRETLDQRGRLPRLRVLPDTAEGRFSPQPRHQTKPLWLHPQTCASTGATGRAQGGGLGACAGTGRRWVRLRRGQVWPCSPAPRGIDVVRAGLSPAAGSTSGGTSRAGAMPARRLGTRGTTPQMLHPGDVCPQRFIHLGSCGSHCLHAASADGCLLGSSFRQMTHLAGEHPGLGYPPGPRPNATAGPGTRACRAELLLAPVRKLPPTSNFGPML